MVRERGRRTVVRRADIWAQHGVETLFLRPYTAHSLLSAGGTEVTLVAGIRFNVYSRLLQFCGGIIDSADCCQTSR